MPDYINKYKQYNKKNKNTNRENTLNPYINPIIKFSLPSCKEIFPALQCLSINEKMGDLIFIIFLSIFKILYFSIFILIILYFLFYNQDIKKMIKLIQY